MQCSHDCSDAATEAPWCSDGLWKRPIDFNRPTITRRNLCKIMLMATRIRLSYRGSSAHACYDIKDFWCRFSSSLLPIGCDPAMLCILVPHQGTSIAAHQHGTNTGYFFLVIVSHWQNVYWLNYKIPNSIRQWQAMILLADINKIVFPTIIFNCDSKEHRLWLYNVPKDFCLIHFIGPTACADICPILHNNTGNC